LTWLDRRDRRTWLDRDEGAKRPKARKPSARVYSVKSVAGLLDVSKATVYKWLMEDEETGESVIPAAGWYKMPSNGSIRIYDWVVEKLLKGEL